MSDQLTAASTAQPQPVPDDDDLGIDRDFLLKMAQIPFLAIGWTAAAWLAHLLWGATVGDLTQPPEGSPANLGPLVVVCIGMILASGWRSMPAGAVSARRLAARWSDSFCCSRCCRSAAWGRAMSR
jgi:hypothetical protein